MATEWTGQSARHRMTGPPSRTGYDEPASPSALRLMLFLVLAVLILSMVPWLGETTGLIGRDAPPAPAPTAPGPTCAGGVVCEPGIQGGPAPR